MYTLRDHGFARYPGSDVCPDLTEAHLAPFTRYFHDLPADPNDPYAGRHRRYARGVILPWSRHISWVPGTPDPDYGTVALFNQGNRNPEHPGATRRFPYIHPEILNQPLLRRLILFDLDHVSWPDPLTQHPVQVSMHFIRLLATPKSPAVASPNCFHQDGGADNTYTVHLLTRHNATGGINMIAPPSYAGRSPNQLPNQPHTQFTLKNPLDTYTVRDSKVSHYISPVHTRDNKTTGERSIILIGLIPYLTPPR